MAFPDYPTIPDPWPDRAQGQSAFDTAVSGTFTFFGNLQTWASGWQTEADSLEAALVAANLPSLTGQAGRGIMPNAAEDGVTFSAPLHTLAGHRNKIINGQFSINQRGAASYTANGGYTLDRWRLSVGAGAACTITRRNDFASGVTLGSSEDAGIPGNPEFYLRWARGTAGTGRSALEQRIEGVETLAGQTVTVTFWVRGNSATTIDARLRQNFGTGGSPSSQTENVVLLKTPVTTSWTKKTGSVVLSGVSGKTLGTNGDDSLNLFFRRAHDDTNPTASVDIANVSLVAGDATNEADPGGWRDETTERLLCKRYYNRIPWDAGTARRYGVESVGDDIVDAGGGVFQVPMRATPSASQALGTFDNCTFASIIAGTESFCVRVALGTTGYYRAYNGNISFDAEL